MEQTDQGKQAYLFQANQPTRTSSPPRNTKTAAAVFCTIFLAAAAAAAHFTSLSWSCRSSSSRNKFHVCLDVFALMFCRHACPSPAAADLLNVHLSETNFLVCRRRRRRICPFPPMSISDPATFIKSSDFAHSPSQPLYHLFVDRMVIDICVLATGCPMQLFLQIYYVRQMKFFVRLRRGRKKYFRFSVRCCCCCCRRRLHRPNDRFGL
jgi:hypothetical protein